MGASTHQAATSESQKRVNGNAQAMDLKSTVPEVTKEVSELAKGYFAIAATYFKFGRTFVRENPVLGVAIASVTGLIVGWSMARGNRGQSSSKL